MSDIDIREGDLIQAARGEEVHTGRAQGNGDGVVFLPGLIRPVDELERHGYLVAIIERGVSPEPGYYVNSYGAVIQIVPPGEAVGPRRQNGPLPEDRGPWQRLRLVDEVRSEAATELAAAIRRAMSLPTGDTMTVMADGSAWAGKHGHRYHLIEVDALDGVLRAYGAKQ